MNIKLSLKYLSRGKNNDIICYMARMTIKKKLFVKNIAEGMNQTQSAILAGYSRTGAKVTGSKLMKNEAIKNALEEIGLTDHYLAKQLKRNIKAGSGMKANADTALRAIDIVTKLKGYQETEKAPENVSQTNIYIQELKTMSNDDLQKQLKEISIETSKYINNA